MTYKILAFGASSSRKSINKQFAIYAANQVEDAEVQILDLNDFEMPIFSVDRQNKNGIHPLAIDFKKYIAECDGIIISLAEHNGAYSAAFKNIFDWISRIEKNVWEDKPMLLLSTSPGGRGGSTVLSIAVDKFRRMNEQVVAGISLPYFHKNFSTEEGVIDPDLATELAEKIAEFAGRL